MENKQVRFCVVSVSSQVDKKEMEGLGLEKKKVHTNKYLLK
jgi:hypothetical protein